MSLQSITNLNVDFYDKKYILINAKQLDKNSRFISVTCYNHGEPYPINSGEHSAYIRYKKSDDHSVFNFCEINYQGKITVELTEQMLASDGICYADLVIVNKGSASVNTDTGEIVAIDNASILSTMTFCIDVSETAVVNSEIESSYEFSGLNEALEKAEAEYTEVILTAKSYAVGGTDMRENEDVDNAKYYYEQSLENANNAAASELNAANSATAAATSEANALTSADKAAISDINASVNALSASASASSAETSEIAAKGYATTAQNSMNSAVNSATSASTSAANAYNYYLQTEAITNGLNGAFHPKGTCSFGELMSAITSGELVLAAGDLYHISDNFVTDESFRCGAGVEYPAGTNVYYTSDGWLDCLVGTTVAGVKGNNETSYRNGNVNLTADNVGAIPTTDIATVDEVTNYLGI